MATLIEVRVTGLPNMPDLTIRSDDQGKFRVHNDTDGVIWAAIFDNVENALTRIVECCHSVNEPAL